MSNAAQHDTNTQHRATCPACFAQQAVRGGEMVAHGYKRPQNWHSNVGNCAGVGRAHFGTDAGRNVTAEIAASLRRQAAGARERAAEPSTLTVTARKRVAAGVYTTVIVDNPTPLQQADAARRLLFEAGQMDATAAEFEQRVAAWQPAEPVAVQVERKQALVHWRTPKRWHGAGKACAGSVMGAHKSYGVTEIEHVTCDKCRALHARLAQ